MKTKLFFILLSLILIGCDFFAGSSEPVQNQQQKSNQQTKQQPIDYYKVKKQDSSGFVKVDMNDNSTKTTSTSNNTLENESKKQKDLSEVDRYKEKIEDLQNQLQTARKQSNSILQKSTYTVKNEEIVSKILYEMYVKELESLKAANKSEDILSEKFKKFFTVEYCDDRVLEWLDDFVDKNIRYIARRMRINYNRLTDPDATGKQIISSK